MTDRQWVNVAAAVFAMGGTLVVFFGNKNRPSGEGLPLLSNQRSGKVTLITAVLVVIAFLNNFLASL